MPRIKRVCLESYTTVNNYYLQDASLGLVERGLLTTMLSLPDGWKFSIRGLAAILPDGRDKIERALNKLKEKGYLKTTQTFDDERKFKDVLYEFCDRPVFVNQQRRNKKNQKEKAKRNNQIPVESLGNFDTFTASFGDFSPCPENPDPANTDNNKINKNKSTACFDGDFVQNDKVALDGEKASNYTVHHNDDTVIKSGIAHDGTDDALKGLQAQTVRGTNCALSDNFPNPTDLKRIKDVNELRSYIRDKIVVYDFCLNKLKIDQYNLDIVVELLVEMLSSDRQWLKGEYVGIREVRARLCELNAERIAYILTSLLDRDEPIANQKAYLKTALLNSREPIDVKSCRSRITL